MWCSLFIFGLLFGITEQTNSSLILSTITARAPSSSSSGRSSLSIASTYYGSLSSSSATFSRPPSSSGSLYYYQAIQVRATVSGTYSLTTSSLIDTYGCLYDGAFDASNPLLSLIACDDDSGSSQQFLINQNLQSGRTYILVVTTYAPSTTGSYSLLVSGGYSVTLIELRTVTSSRSGSLSSSNSMFTRPGGSSSSYYYDAIDVAVYTSGTYVFGSNSSNSLDTYGCLYSGSFDPSYPYQNQLSCNDDSGGMNQFQLTQYLSSSTKYILVVTTSSTYATGSYVASVTGPARTTLAAYYIAPGLTTGIIAAIVIGSLVGCILCIGAIIAFCMCLNRQSTGTRTTIITGQYHPSGQPAPYPHGHGNAGYDSPPPYNPYGSPYPKV